MFRYISLLLFGAGALHTAMAVKLTLVDNCGGNLKWTWVIEQLHLTI